MKDLEQNIRNAHAFRNKMMDDIFHANLDEYEYHRKKFREYHKPDNSLGLTNRIKNKPIRSTKNHLLSMNSMCCLIAEYGGMDALTSHYLAEKYAVLIENADSIDSLYNIADDFLYQYLHYKNRPLSDESIPLLDQVDMYIEKEFMNNINVQTVADNFYHSREHLSRIYKQERERTIHDKIIQTRLQEAKKFLRGSQLTITEISTRIGFNSSQYFSRVFKEQTGYTPTQYRNA